MGTLWVDDPSTSDGDYPHRTCDKYEPSETLEFPHEKPTVCDHPRFDHDLDCHGCFCYRVDNGRAYRGARVRAIAIRCCSIARAERRSGRQCVRTSMLHPTRPSVEGTIVEHDSKSTLPRMLISPEFKFRTPVIMLESRGFLAPQNGLDRFHF